MSVGHLMGGMIGAGAGYAIVELDERHRGPNSVLGHDGDIVAAVLGGTLLGLYFADELGKYLAKQIVIGPTASPQTMQAINGLMDLYR